MGVHGPIGFEVAPNPLEKMFARRAFRNFHPIMQTGQAHTTFHDLVESFEMLVQQVTSTSVAINDHSRGIIEHTGVLGIPVIGDHD